MPKFSPRSEARLLTCHKDLQRLFYKVIEDRDCSILCGYRGEQEQNDAYNKGYSKLKWPDSNHNQLPSLAVDVMPYPIDWEDIDGIMEFANFVEQTAKLLNINIVWGGSWKSFKDYPHYEIKE